MKKTMKKLMVLIMTMMMGMSLVACGGADKQPAIDAFNKTSTSFNEVANIINENPQAYDQDLVDTMVDMAGVLNEHKQILESDDDVEEEKLQEMIDWYGTVDEWSGLLRLRKKFQNSLLLDHVVKTAYHRGGRIGVPALF